MSNKGNHGKYAPQVCVGSLFLLIAIACVAAANSHAATPTHHNHKAKHGHKHNRTHRRHSKSTCTVIVNGKKVPPGGFCMPQETTVTTTTPTTEVPSAEVKPEEELKKVCLVAYYKTLPNGESIMLPDECPSSGPIVIDECQVVDTPGRTIPLCEEFTEKEKEERCKEKICELPEQTEEECPEEQGTATGPKG